MKIYSKEGKELKMGDWVVETVEKRTPTSKIVQKTNFVSRMDIVKGLKFLSPFFVVKA